MLAVLHDLASSCWKLVLGTAMPWRVALFLSAGGVVGYGVGSIALRLLLLPEFLVTTRLRHWGWRPIPGTHVFGRAIWGGVWLLRALLCLAIALALLSFVTWFLVPHLSDTIAEPLRQYFEWWASLGATPQS